MFDFAFTQYFTEVTEEVEYYSKWSRKLWF